MLIANIMIDYLKILEETKDSIFYIEEIIMALAFLFLAAIDTTAFKIGIALFLGFIALRLLMQKKQLSYGWLRVILLICILNPLLIGIVLSF